MSQLFKNIYPKHKFLTYIQKISIKKKNYYLFTSNLFKKLKYNDGIREFLKDIKPYYKKSKQFYVDRKMSLKHFITIIRQLCKIHNIKYENKIRYLHNKYEIDYYIYINDEHDNSDKNDEHDNGDKDDKNN